MACTYTCYLIRYDGIDIRNNKITILSAEHQVWCVKTEIFHCSIDFLIEKKLYDQGVFIVFSILLSARFMRNSYCH